MARLPLFRESLEHDKENCDFGGLNVDVSDLEMVWISRIWPVTPGEWYKGRKGLFNRRGGLEIVGDELRDVDTVSEASFPTPADQISRFIVMKRVPSPRTIYRVDSHVVLEQTELPSL